MIKVFVDGKYVEQSVNGEEDYEEVREEERHEGGEDTIRYEPTISDLAFKENSPEILSEVFDVTYAEDKRNNFDRTGTLGIYLTLLNNEATPEALMLKVVSVLEEHFNALILDLKETDDDAFCEAIGRLSWIADFNPVQQVRERVQMLVEQL